MTILDEHPIASGITRRPRPRPALLGRDAVQDFHLGLPNGARQVTLSIAGMPGGLRPWWVQYVEQELNHLLRLRPCWDGRRALPVEEIAVETMVRVLSTLMDEASSLPQLFPLTDGGLQAEWHVGGNDIEIEVEGRGAAHVLATAADGEIVADGIVETSRIAARRHGPDLPSHAVEPDDLRSLSGCRRRAMAAGLRLHNTTI